MSRSRSSSLPAGGRFAPCNFPDTAAKRGNGTTWFAAILCCNFREHDVCAGGNPFRLCRHQMIKSKAIGRATLGQRVMHPGDGQAVLADARQRLAEARRRSYRAESRQQRAAGQLSRLKE